MEPVREQLQVQWEGSEIPPKALWETLKDAQPLACLGFPRSLCLCHLPVPSPPPCYPGLSPSLA